MVKLKYFIIGFVAAIAFEPTTKLNHCYLEPNDLKVYHRIRVINYEGQEVNLYGYNLSYGSWTDFIYDTIKGVKECKSN